MDEINKIIEPVDMSLTDKQVKNLLWNPQLEVIQLLLFVLVLALLIQEWW